MPIVFFPFFWFHLNFFDGLCIFVKNRQNDSNLGKKIDSLIGLDPSLYISISTEPCKEYKKSLLKNVYWNGTLIFPIDDNAIHHLSNLDTQNIRFLNNTNSFISVINSTQPNFEWYLDSWLRLSAIKLCNSYWISFVLSK